MNTTPTTVESDYVRKCLKDASEFGLEADVVTWALYHMKQNPEQTIEQAMETGMIEWDV